MARDRDDDSRDSRDDSRGDSRDDRPRRPEGRDDRPRRRDDDLGPSVRGFGDSTPAFMLIAIPKFRRDRVADTVEAETAETATAD